ncbi:hypothetical protein FOMPIDRAFT_1053715 [Fomitopsis schrenkii]|uniref:Uncharacterized protein n=1 Tax=Fomitopsis schrenkii TaxID=2126942 RepID=S8DTI9_FOMSC|nr:hypothetical protein FOMPIDRAFT_1053715 [Fomitopsis schrenkii]
MRDYLVEKITARLIGSTINVDHAERLTRVGLKQFHKYKNDPTTGKSSAKYGVWTPHEVYTELRKNTASDAATKAFVDASAKREKLWGYLARLARLSRLWNVCGACQSERRAGARHIANRRQRRATSSGCSIVNP